jgi:hypothetical protein
LAVALLTAACVPAARTTLPACPGSNGRAPGWADYFPERTFDARADVHNEVTLKWFGADLAAADEPVLSCPRPGQPEAYRLLFSPSFADTWIVRVERTAGGAELQATRLPESSDVPTKARPKERRQRHLSPADWTRLTAAVAAADFWNMPSPETRLGLDGQTWVVEGVRPGAYHAVERWEPQDGIPYRALGATFLDLAGLGALAVIPPPAFVKPVGPEDLK